MSSASRDIDNAGDLAVASMPPDLASPPLYHVVLINDDFTPMRFVVALLVNVFALGIDQAERIMMAVHKQGRGVAGTYTKDVAETRAEQVVHLGQAHKHPIRALVEPAS